MTTKYENAAERSAAMLAFLKASRPRRAHLLRARDVLLRLEEAPPLGVLCARAVSALKGAAEHLSFHSDERTGDAGLAVLLPAVQVLREMGDVDVGDPGDSLRDEVERFGTYTTLVLALAGALVEAHPEASRALEGTAQAVAYWEMEVV